MLLMSRGFLWFCQNNENTDYVELSIALAKSLKKHNKHNQVCVVTDSKTKINSKHIDIVRVLREDASSEHEVKWANEYKAFMMSPFTHTIKLVADMLWTNNTDWWWYYLWQHDLVFALDCFDYRNNVVSDKKYRPFHATNMLPNIYSDLTYFRKSHKSVLFGRICQALTSNWDKVRDTMLVSCHDTYPSTDVIYALAYRLMDPTQNELINYPWFKTIHNKRSIHGLNHIYDHESYLMPTKLQDKIVLGSYSVTRPWHYVNKKMLEVLDVSVL